MKSSLSKKQLIEFGLIIGFGFPFIIGWIIPSLYGHQFKLWTLWITLVSLTLTLLKPYYLYYPYKIWMFIGTVLGWINSRIILGLVFLLVLLPIAFFMKLFGYDPLRLKRGNAKSYREIRQHKSTDLTKIF